MLGLMVAQAFVRGCLNVLIVVAAFRLLHAGAGAVGYLTAAIGFGGLVGAMRAMTIGGRRLAVPFAVSLACWGLPIALVAPAPRLASALVLLGVIGAANSIEDVTGFTLVQRVVPDELLNRVLGIFWGVAMGAVAVGSVTAPGLVHTLGARPSFLLVGSLLPLLAVASYRGLARVDALVPATTERALLEGVTMFPPLSLSTRERLARRLFAVPVQAGDDVIRAGDSGDRFYIYIIGHGDLAVDAGGEPKQLGVGDFFGEIALLRDLPRTATVTATTEALLYALHRHDFLAAITGHAAAERAATNTVEARLGTAS